MTLVKKAAFAIAVLALAACGTMSSMMGGGKTSRVQLSGAEEVPPVSTSAQGEGSFTVGNDGSVKGSVTTTGVFTEFTLPGFPNAGGSDTSGLAVGPDGNIWYTIAETDRVVELVVPR